ncbi:MAG: DNA-3-methyladenine glycosylase [Nitrosomonas sp.]|nr:DNA-3-methyladenine glycosylase [Nitrosomonas sp.]MDP1949628.1 DNA-3-methyladenine glycosylase [Nitrosomonas sp.]
MIPIYWKQATQELTERDEVIGNLILCFNDAALDSRDNAFVTLARSIVGQQISVKAAESVWQKIIVTLPEITPRTIHLAEEIELRSCGLSHRKISYLQELSQHFLDGALNEADWKEMDDEALIVQLTQIQGIGRWTAEMFLIFHMLRPDILPLADIGLQRAISRHYNANQPMDKSSMRILAKSWQPWRSVATWYLWRSLDPLPVNY